MDRLCSLDIDTHINTKIAYVLFQCVLVNDINNVSLNKGLYLHLVGISFLE